MKKILSTFFALSFVLFFFLYLIPYTLYPSLAQATCDPGTCSNKSGDDKGTCLSDQITACQSLLQDTKNQEKTLSSQLRLIDGQTQVTNLKIEDTNYKIEKLEREINELSTRIDRIGATLDSLSEILLRRIVQTYKFSNSLSTLDLIFSSENFADLIGRLKYIQVAQSYDKKKLYELQATKLAYNDQKEDKETRQAEAEKLNKDLETYKIQLDGQKKAKDELLRVTKNDEARYQALLAQARAEYLAIQGIVAGRGKETEAGPVSEGQRIATVIDGPSCNSGGAHLHFTVVKDNSALNPFNYLKSIDNQNCSGSSCGSSDGDPFNPSGSWEWPLSGPTKMNQGYGNTWAVKNTYVGSIYSFHNGLDIEGSSTEVKAVKTGTLFKGSYSGVAGCALPYVRVKHNDEGLETLYLHVYY